MAEQKGIDSDELLDLSKDLILRMSSGLPFINYYDRIAFPIQKQGIPVICQDFPGIQNK